MAMDISRIRSAHTGRCSSWDVTGGNQDSWVLQPGESRVLADIKGPGRITHIWMTQGGHYRECLLKFTWDNARKPSIVVPLGDFFCLGHGMVNSFQNALFAVSAKYNNRFGGGCALNCYAPMPFRERAVVELVNESKEVHGQYFYVDYETVDHLPEDAGYFHAEFRRVNPFGGWGPEVMAYAPNKGRQAWDNNYVIVDTVGKGHYIGCNLSVSNFEGTWWGEGDDMIWVDGYKWPPDLHGTGSEDYLNQAWGMQDNAFLHNGSSLFEVNTAPALAGSYYDPPFPRVGSYQTSYVLHLENPVHFRKSIKVSIEHGHGNNLQNEMSSVGYWYADQPTAVLAPPPLAKRMPVMQDAQGKWLFDEKNQCPGKKVPMTPAMRRARRDQARTNPGK